MNTNDSWIRGGGRPQLGALNEGGHIRPHVTDRAITEIRESRMARTC